MKTTRIEHIGIAVKDLDSSIRFYEELLGLRCQSIEEVSEQKVRTAIFKLGETKIELLESTDEDGPIGKFVKNKGEGIHHIAFEVDDLGSALDELSGKNIRLIGEEPYKGAEGFDIIFLHPKSTGGVLIEICGRPA